MNTLKVPDPFEMLYHARWNVPRASLALGLTPCEESWEKVKKEFREWCLTVSRPLPGDLADL